MSHGRSQEIEVQMELNRRTVRAQTIVFEAMEEMASEGIDAYTAITSSVVGTAFAHAEQLSPTQELEIMDLMEFYLVNRSTHLEQQGFDMKRYAELRTHFSEEPVSSLRKRETL